jgi:hypothetical protein
MLLDPDQQAKAKVSRVFKTKKTRFLEINALQMHKTQTPLIKRNQLSDKLSRRDI